MASRREQNMKYRRYSGRVNGNLAYDPAYEERQRRLRREREYEREHERQREEFMRPPQRKVQKKAAPVRRQREKVSLGTLCGFMALAAMVALMIMCRATADGNLRAGRLRAEGDFPRSRTSMSRCSRATKKPLTSPPSKRRRPRPVWPSPAPRRSTTSTCRSPTAWSSTSRRARTFCRGCSRRLATAYAQWWNISNERSYT